MRSTEDPQDSSGSGALALWEEAVRLKWFILAELWECSQTALHTCGKVTKELEPGSDWWGDEKLWIKAESREVLREDKETLSPLTQLGRGVCCPGKLLAPSLEFSDPQKGTALSSLMWAQRWPCLSGRMHWRPPHFPSLSNIPKILQSYINNSSLALLLTKTLSRKIRGPRYLMPSNQQSNSWKST